MSKQAFDELVDRLRLLREESSVEVREAMSAATAEACALLDRAHAAYGAVGGVETGAALLAIVDAQTRLLAAAAGQTVDLACDAVTEADDDAYDRELTKLAPLVDVAFQTRLGDTWSASLRAEARPA